MLLLKDTGGIRDFDPRCSRVYRQLGDGASQGKSNNAEGESPSSLTGTHEREWTEFGTKGPNGKA
jgi:hypothetical protein